MAATPPRAAKLLHTFTMPVDPAVFNGVPSVTALKPMPKARVLLAAGMDRRVVCCDLAAQGQKHPVSPGKHMAWAHDNWVHDLDVHPDGVRVATGGTDRKIKIWKWGADKPLADFKAHDEWVRAVAFSPDGRLLASAGDDCVVRLWEVDTAKAVATLEPRGGFLDVLAWSNDGKQLLVGGNDGKLHTWNVAQREVTSSVDLDNRRLIEDEPLNGGFSYPGGIRGLACSPDGKRIAVVGLTTLHVVEPGNGKSLLKQDGRGFGVAFDPTSRRMAFSQEKALVVWDFQTGAASHRFETDQLGLFDICFLEGGRQFASGGCNGKVGVWDLST